MDAPADEVDETPLPPVRKAAPPPAPRRRAPAADEDEGGGSNAAGEDAEEERPVRRPPPRKRAPAAQEDDEDGGSSRGRVSARKRASEDEEEEEEEEETPLAVLPVVAPRLISLDVGVAVMGRNFHYNTALQKENTLPRSGLALALESYPLIQMTPDWYTKIGVGANLAVEFGAAALQQGNGSSVSFPVSQQRWQVDLRYAILASESIVIIPTVGYGKNHFDLKIRAPVAPSACNTQSTSPCLADIDATYVAGDVHARFALVNSFSLSLSAGYIQGISVSKGPGQIGQERNTIMSGFRGELAGNLMLLDWLMARVAVPVTRFGYTFAGGATPTATYTAASELYYGVVVSAVASIL